MHVKEFLGPTHGLGRRLKALRRMQSLTCPADHCHHNIDIDWLVPAADSAGRTRAFFTASAGNAQSANHVPASLGLSNIISLTYSDDSDTIKGNKGYALSHNYCHHTQEHSHQALPLQVAFHGFQGHGREFRFLKVHRLMGSGRFA